MATILFRSLFFMTLTFVFATNTFAASKSPSKEQAKNPLLFGDPLTKKAPLTLAEIVKDPKKWDKKKIVVQGKVERVCENKGCWLTLKAGTTPPVRTFFKDGGFLVPKTILGKTVLAEGFLVDKEVSESTAKHLLEDQGAPKSEIDKIKGPQQEIQFIADGVLIVPNA